MAVLLAAQLRFFSGPDLNVCIQGASVFGGAVTLEGPRRLLRLPLFGIFRAEGGGALHGYLPSDPSYQACKGCLVKYSDLFLLATNRI